MKNETPIISKHWGQSGHNTSPDTAWKRSHMKTTYKQQDWMLYWYLITTFAGQVLWYPTVPSYKCFLFPLLGRITFYFSRPVQTKNSLMKVNQKDEIEWINYTYESERMKENLERIHTMGSRMFNFLLYPWRPEHKYKSQFYCAQTL